MKITSYVYTYDVYMFFDRGITSLIQETICNYNAITLISNVYHNLHHEARHCFITYRKNHLKEYFLSLSLLHSYNNSDQRLKLIYFW